MVGTCATPTFLVLHARPRTKNLLKGIGSSALNFPHSERGESLSNDDSWQSDIPNQDMI